MFWSPIILSVTTKLVNIPKLVKEVILSNFQGKFVGQYANYILANTQKDAEFLRKHCPNARFVRAVGNPIFDEMLKLDGTARKDTAHRFRVPEDKKIVLFLSGSQVEHGLWTEEQKMLANRSILDSLETLCNQIHVIIKLHPVEQNVFTLTWKQHYNDFISVTKSDISRLIQASDVVITWPSTAILNVVLARKPLIVMDFFNQRAQGITLLAEMTIDHGAAHEVFNATELREALADVIANGKLKEKLQRCERVFSLEYLGTIDGKSSERIADAIVEANLEFHTTSHLI